jgi:hypothetical protein
VVQLDHHVVDPHADERGEQVLDRFDRCLLAAQAGRVLDAGQVVDGRRDLEAAKIRAPKSNAVIRRSGLKGKRDLFA